MTESKYKVGDIIMRYDGVLLRIGWFESAKGLYHGHVGDSIHQGWASDADIKCAVKIIPITDKPYCKDCKHVEKVKNSYTKREWLVFSKMCPRGEMSERIDYEEQPSVDDNDTPHDDCYCFEPKEEIE
jgi:hypothetical protein